MPLPPDEVTIVLRPHVPQNQLPCTVEGCTQRRLARGVCNAHYRQARRAYLRQQREGAARGSS